MSGGQFRGTSAEQDSRFSNKEERQLKSLNKEFPPELRKKVDLSKVQWESIKPWIGKRTTELLGGLEDEILINFIIDMVEGKKTLDPRRIYISLSGFLESNTGVFVKELWTLLIDASSSETGVPTAFVQEIKEEVPYPNGGIHGERSRRRDYYDRSRRRDDDYRSSRQCRDRYYDDEYRSRRRRRSRSTDRRRRRRSPSVEAKMKQEEIKTEDLKKEEET